MGGRRYVPPMFQDFDAPKDVSLRPIYLQGRRAKALGRTLDQNPWTQKSLRYAWDLGWAIESERQTKMLICVDANGVMFGISGDGIPPVKACNWWDCYSAFDGVPVVKAVPPIPLRPIGNPYE